MSASSLHPTSPIPPPTMIVLGIDPGTRTAGYGVVEVEGRTERALDFESAREVR